MYKAKPFLDKDSLLSQFLLYSFIHIYVSSAWASTHKTNLKKIHSQEKHALRILYYNDRYYHAKNRFRSCNVINVCKLDLLNTFIFMHKIKTGADPAAFHATFKMPSHSYRTRFWSANYSKPKTRLHKSRFWISIRGPAIWNIFVANTEIEFEFSSKTKLLNIEYEIIFF